jgi:CubicO group peptidase (beta-lactamase class C family)
MASQSVASSESITAFIPELERLITEAMDEWKVPGLAVAVVQNGEVAFLRASGLRDVETGLTVTTDTQFQIASVTKSFNATGLALLVDEGRMDWKKPVREYIPEFRLHDAVATDRITVRDLLCHHSGLPRHDWIWLPGDLSPVQMLAAMRYLEPSDDLRSSYHYSNLGYVVASIVAERVSGQSWSEFYSRSTDRQAANDRGVHGGGYRRRPRCGRALRDERGYPPALETLADARDGRRRHQHLDCGLRELASLSSRQGRVRGTTAPITEFYTGASDTARACRCL